MDDAASIQQQLDQEMERLFQHFEQVPSWFGGV
jgi:hypothetical protein